VRAPADGRDKGHLIAIRHLDGPVGKLLVERGPHPFALGERWVCAPRDVVDVGQRRAGRHLAWFDLDSRLFAQPSEKPHPYGDRYRHDGILLTDENVDLLAGVEGSLDRGSGAFRAPVPESDEHVASIDKALVAGGRPGRVRQLIK